jgi:hypothetical protein
MSIDRCANVKTIVESTISAGDTVADQPESNGHYTVMVATTETRANDLAFRLQRALVAAGFLRPYMRTTITPTDGTATLELIVGVGDIRSL